MCTKHIESFIFSFYFYYKLLMPISSNTKNTNNYRIYTYNIIC